MEREVLKGTSTDGAKRLLPCWTCQQKIQFDPSRKSKTGKLIPLNEDGSPHDCPNKRRSQMGATEAAQRHQADGSAGAQESRELAEKLLRGQENLRAEVKAGLGHVEQRLNFLQTEVRRLAREASP